MYCLKNFFYKYYKLSEKGTMYPISLILLDKPDNNF